MSSISSPGGRSAPPPTACRRGSFRFRPRGSHPMKHHVQLFHIDRDAKPSDPPQPAGGFEVDADTHDAARAAAIARLAADGKTVRSLSFLAEGGLAVVLTQPPPAPSAARVRGAKGGR